MDAPSPKRHCHEVSSSVQNPSSLLSAPGSNQSHLDLIVSSLLSFPNPDSMPSLLSIDRVLDKALASSSSVEKVQNSLADHTVKLTSLLHESTKRCIRKRASVHNFSSWLLPPELTIKVFSKVDTKSLMQAMACCTMFRKCAKDPLSYSHINLTTSARKVDDGVVSTMITRAGKELRFLELGHVDRLAKSKTPHLLKGSCLAPLSHNRGFIGKYLRSLHLYDVRFMNDKLSIDSLSACSNITDLKIVGWYSPCELLLKSLAIKCRFIEHVFFETYASNSKVITLRKESSALVEFLTNIPSLTSLTLINIKLKDAAVLTLAKVARKLKHMNLSRNPTIKGRFLRDSGHILEESALETLILRDCSSLEEKEVLQFLVSLLAENFRSIRHIDVSNSRGLLSDGGKRSRRPNFPLEKLKEERPGVKIVANFNPQLSRSKKRSRGIISSGNDAEVHMDEVPPEEDVDLGNDDN